MAQPNLLVLFTVSPLFAIQFTNSVLFFTEIPYWFGYIWNTLGIYVATGLLIRAQCVQGVCYREVYGDVRTYATSNDVIEINAQDNEIGLTSTNQTPAQLDKDLANTDRMTIVNSLSPVGMQSSMGGSKSPELQQNINIPMTPVLSKNLQEKPQQKLPTLQLAEIKKSNKQKQESQKNRITVNRKFNSMRSELNYGVRDLRSAPCFMMSYIGYILLMIYLLAQFFARIQISIRKDIIESFSDFPEDCSDFAKEYCVRSSLFQNECRGPQVDQAIVFKASQEEMATVLVNCISEGQATEGYNYGVLALNPIVSGCSLQNMQQSSKSQQKTVPIDEAGFSRSVRSFIGTKSLQRFIKFQCFEYTQILLQGFYTGFNYDLYVKQQPKDELTDTEMTYVQIQVQNRNGPRIFDNSFQIANDLYKCIAKQFPTENPNRFLPCSRF